MLLAGTRKTCATFPTEIRLAIRPKKARAKKTSVKKARKKSAAKKAKSKKKARAKKASAGREKAGKKKAGHRKGPRKASANRPAAAARGGRSPKRGVTTKTHPATIARLYPKRVGSVSHYYPQSEAALIRLEAGEIHVGDAVHIRGHTTDFYERIEELRVDDQPVERAKSGQTIGIKLSRTVRENDGVFLLSN